ncbi:MAG: arginine--tRNA ligase [Candidatus Krumholzibacteria bacterium]|nr:arginine--tRNA ligase [Candidatus Krumholzibacteria bacterium]
MAYSPDETTSLSARSRIRTAIEAALTKAGIEGGTDMVHLERPANPENGDISCNVALVAAKKLRRNPRELAGMIRDALELEKDFVDGVEVAGPGFLNFTFSREYLSSQVATINTLGSSYGASDIGKDRKVQVEYVSANPTGPLVIVAARAAAVGSSLVNILRKTGHEVEAEYYLNDAGSQVRKLGLSLMARFRQRLGEDVEFPEDGYPGDYLVDIAAEIPEETGREWLGSGDESAREAFGSLALEKIIVWIREDLEKFGVHFDTFFNESTLHREGGEVAEALEFYKNKGVVYEKEGASWFRSTDFGDEKDRVLVRSDGTPTYFLADAAYHLNKFRRGYDHVIDIFGPDHHGHISRLKAASVVFGANEDWLDVMTVQWVRLIEDGQQVKMSKRGGVFETLASLVEDVGSDASKFFFLMRKTNAHLDFNLTLARKSTDENPVYYVQYAHARICSVIAFAADEGVKFPEDLDCVDKLVEPEEIGLIRHLVVFPQLIEGAAEACEPHRLTTYAQELAASFHRFYHICRIVSNDTRLSQARLLLAEATRIVLAETLNLLGISAPERM